MATGEPLVWIDLEMTGLEVERHVIVEIACIVTDADLEPLDAGIDVVVHASPAELTEMDAVVSKMHARSGLTPAIEASSVDVGAAEAAVLAYVRGHVNAPGVAPLCGNSIGVDRRFLDRYMRELDRYLHYRSIDVSSLKELCRRWHPAVYKGRPGKSDRHRALDDILESINELRYYRDHLLALPVAPAAGEADAG